MSYGNDQTQANRLRIWLIVVSVLMVIGLTVGVVVSIRWNRYKREQEMINQNPPNTSGEGALLEASSTPEPTMTMTDLPTPSQTVAPTITGTPEPAMSATPTINTDVFPYDVETILYLADSYEQERYWHPGDAVVLDVPEDDYEAINDLLFASHVQREQAFLTETMPDLDLLNDGYAVTQLTRYYTESIDKDDNCTMKISIVDGQFQTFIIQYDGTTARTVTVKVETRVETCGGVISGRSVYNDYYGYENWVRKYTNGNETAWKIIEHTAEIGVK